MNESEKQKARAVFAGQAAILEACGPFDYAETILHGFERKSRFEPYKNLPVFTRNYESRVSLGRNSVSLAIDDIVENSTTDFLCIKDHVIPMVGLLLSADTFAKEIQECVDNGKFDDNQNVKAEFEILVQFLLGGCHKVGKLLCEHLDAIKAQKDTLLESAENSIHEQILAVQQNIKEIKDTANNNQNYLSELLTLIAQSIASSNWLDVSKNYSLLGAEVDALNLKKLPDLAKQERVLGENLLAIKDSFQQIPNLQDQLQKLVDRTKDISEDKLAELEVTRQALLRNTNASATDPTTSDALETTQQTGWLAPLRTIIEQLTGRHS